MSSNVQESITVNGVISLDMQVIYPRLMSGDQAAWADFFSHFKGRLDTYFKGQKVYSVQDREELLQETMAVIISKLDKYDPSLPIENWVYGVAKKMVLRLMQRVYSPRYENEVENYDAFDKELISEGHFNEELEKEANHRLQCLRDALKTLSESDQQILALRSERVISFEEIAEELGIKCGTTRMRYKRALERLQKAMQEIVIQPEYQSPL